MSLLFLTCGLTHTGKTTFGAKLRKALGESAKFIHVDNDVVDEFVKANYNNLRTDPEVLARRTPSDPDLRLRIPQLVISYALSQGYSAIATATHPKQVIRQAYYDIAKANGANVILLIFKTSDKEVAKRIRTNNRDTAILDVSAHGGNHFQELFTKQKKLMEIPTESERQQCFKVFEITEDNTDEILDIAKNLIASHGRDTQSLLS
jgi:hypothetical protein